VAAVLTGELEMTRTLAYWAVLACGLLAAGCGSAVAPQKVPPTLDAARSTVEVSAPGPFPADGLHLVTVTARLLSTNGDPMPGLHVQLAGGARFFARGTTNAAGTFSALFTTTQAGPATFDAMVQLPGSDVVVPVRGGQVVEYLAGPPKVVTFFKSPSSQAAGGYLVPVEVWVVDAYGNRVAYDRPVTVSLDASDANLEGTTTKVPEDGTARFLDLTIARAGHYALRASAPDLPTHTSQPFDVVAGPVSVARSTYSVSAASVPADGESTVTATAHLVDGNGNVCAGRQVRVNVQGNDARVTPGAEWQMTDAHGDLSFSVASTFAEGKILSLLVDGEALNQVVEFLPGPPDSDRTTLSVPDAPVTADFQASAQVTVTVRDRFGNPVPRVAYAFNVDGNRLTNFNPSGFTEGDGQGTLRFASGAAETKHVHLTAPFSNDIDVVFVPGPPDHLVFADVPGSAITGEPLPPVTVRLVDRFGNLETGSTDLVTLQASGAELSGTTSRVLASGAATFDDLSFLRSGKGITLTAHAAAASGASAAFDVSAWRITGPSGPVHHFTSLASGLLAATDTGLFFSGDGTSWTPASPELGFPVVSAMAGDLPAPDGTREAMLATGDGHVYTSPSSRLRWTAHEAGLGGAKVFQFLQSGTTTTFACTPNGVFRDTADGWQPSSSGLTTLDLSAGYEDWERSKLYVGSSDGHVFVSADDGATWSDVGGVLPGRVDGLAVTHLDGFQGTAVYALLDHHDLYLSEDLGATWAAVTDLPSHDLRLLQRGTAVDNVFVATGDLGIGGYSAMGGFTQGELTPLLTVNSLGTTLASSNPETFDRWAATDEGIFRLSWTGVDWENVSTGLSGSRVQTLFAEAGAPYRLFAGTPHGLYVSADGASSWTFSSLRNTDVRSVAVDPADGRRLWAATADQGLFASTDGAATWSARHAGLTATDLDAVVVDPATPGTLYVASATGGVFRSTDGGATWSSASSGMVSLSVTSLTLDASALYATTDGGGVFVSTDGAASWTGINDGLTSLRASRLLRAGGTLFLGTLDAGLFVSDDSGGHWASSGSFASPIQALFTSPIQALAEDPLRGTLYAGTSSELFRSDDLGGSWSPVVGGLPEHDVRSLAALDGTLFVGTRHLGVVRSRSGGH
jgi:hypothetical protein